MTESATERADAGAQPGRPTGPRAIGTAAPAVDTSVDRRTGEPRRPAVVWVAASLLYAGVALAVAGMLWSFWTAIDSFETAAWLTGTTPTEPGSGLRVLMVSGLFASTLLVGAAALIAGYYGWRGYRWARVAGVLATAVSFLTLLVNPLASSGIAAIALGALLFWLPPAGRFFERWHQRRHPQAGRPAIVGRVVYGPLPRFR